MVSMTQYKSENKYIVNQAIDLSNSTRLQVVAGNTLLNHI